MKDLMLNLSLYSLLYVEAWKEFVGPISASLHRSNTDPFEEMSLRWRAVGNAFCDLNSKRFEPKTSAPETKTLPLDYTTGRLL